MNKFLVGIENTFNYDYTENGAKVLSTTGSKVLDLFSQIGALREASEVYIMDLFLKAYKEDKVLTLRTLFYGRDIRKGLGERRIIRVILKNIEKVEFFNIRERIEFDIKYLMGLVTMYGRFDDLFSLDDTIYEKEMYNYYWTVMYNDYLKIKKDSKANISLCGKWAPSINASNKNKRRLAAKLIEYNNLNKVTYNKIRKELLKKLEVVEVKMCQNRWEEIVLENLPSKAFNNYMSCFYNRIPEKMSELKENIKNKKVEINTEAIYPYEIIRSMELYNVRQRNNDFYLSLRKYDEMRELQWKNLPNYIEEDNNVLVVADTSGSMWGGDSNPINISISLALYFSERNCGPYHNKFITFASEPSYIQLEDCMSLDEKISKIPSIIDSTNLVKVFDLILKTAIDNNLSQTDFPKSVIVISDMQFDMGAKADKILLDEIKEKYNKNNYEIPNIIFWNVASNGRPCMMSLSDDVKINMVSGSSPTVFKSILNLVKCTPYESMLEILNSDRYKNYI